YTSALSLHDALPIFESGAECLIDLSIALLKDLVVGCRVLRQIDECVAAKLFFIDKCRHLDHAREGCLIGNVRNVIVGQGTFQQRSEEHTSELQSQSK